MDIFYQGTTKFGLLGIQRGELEKQWRIYSPPGLSLALGSQVEDSSMLSPTPVKARDCDIILRILETKVGRGLSRAGRLPCTLNNRLPCL